MRTRNAMKVRFQVEVLEGRVTPSSVAPAPAGVAPAEVTQQSGITITSATVDPRTGIVTITGTITPSPTPSPFPFPIVPTITLTQAVGRKDAVTSGTTPMGGSTAIITNPDGTFSVTLFGSNGAFKPGDAIASITTFDPFTFTSSTAIIPVRLVNSKG